MPNFANCIITFVIIPSVYLMNDEDTKKIIYKEGWYLGLRHMLGIHNQTKPAELDM